MTINQNFFLLHLIFSSPEILTFYISKHTNADFYDS